MFCKFKSFKQKRILMKKLLCVSLKLRKFMTFKPKQVLIKAFVESHFEVISVYEFQTKANSYEDICGVSV